MCGEIQWSALGTNRAAVVGYNSEGNFFENHPLSGLSGIGDAVSCTFDIGKRRKRQDDMPNNMPMLIPADPDVQRIINRCLSFEARERFAYFGTIPEESPETLANRLDPCPCTPDQAIEDRARFVRHNDRDDCYISSQPVSVRLGGVGIIGLTQMCCYANG